MRSFMPRFSYLAPKTLDEAVAALDGRKNAKVIAGGSDLLGTMKNRIEGPALFVPEVLVDLSSIEGLSYLRSDPQGLRIGAMTTLNEIASSSMVQEQYPALAEAAQQVATPQIRNYATLGGNICQRPRCWYFRGRRFTDCYKKGGEFCYAVTGRNEYNCILEGELCYIVHPSDTAPALMALGASAKIVGPDGQRTVSFDDFFIGPREDVLRENVLASNEILAEIQVPTPAPNTKSTYLKFKERKLLDFAIAGVAAALTFEGSAVKKANVVLSGVAPTPYRAVDAEEFLTGKQIDEAVATEAGQRAVAGARPMSLNAYKVNMVESLVKQALFTLG